MAHPPHIKLMQVQPGSCHSTYLLPNDLPVSPARGEEKKAQGGNENAGCTVPPFGAAGDRRLTHQPLFSSSTPR